MAFLRNCLIVISLVLMIGGYCLADKAVVVDAGAEVGLDKQLKINREVLLNAGDQQMRVDSAVVMLTSESAAARQVLLEVLDSNENLGSRLAVCKALSQQRLSGTLIPNKEDFVLPLVSMLRNGNNSAAMAAAEALQIYEYTLIEGPIDDILGDEGSSSQARLNVIEVLKLQPDMSAILKLAELLDCVDSKVADAAGDALRSLAIPLGADVQNRGDIIEELRNKGIEKFQRDRLIHQDDKIRKLQQQTDFWREKYLESLDSLAESQKDDVGRGQFLGAHLEHEEKAVKLWALNKLYEWRQSTNPKLPGNLEKPLIGLISNPDRDVRLKTAGLLSLMGDFNASGKLLGQLKVEKDGVVQSELLAALGQACYYAFLSDSQVKISVEIRNETLGWALKYLKMSEAGKSVVGAEIIRKLIEQDGLSDETVDIYFQAMSERYQSARRDGQQQLVNDLLTAMTGLCSQGTHREKAAKLYESFFSEALGDDDEAVRYTAVEGLIFIDKAKAIRSLPKILAGEKSGKIRGRIIGLAEEVAGPKDLDWLGMCLEREDEKASAWRAMVRIFGDAQLDVINKWILPIENYVTAGKISEDEALTFFELAEKLCGKKGDGQGGNCDIRGIRGKLASLYFEKSDYEKSAKYYAMLLSDAADVKERGGILARLVTCYFEVGNWDAGAQVLTNVVQEKDVIAGSEVVLAVSSFLDKAKEGEKGKVIGSLAKINIADRPVWQELVKQWQGLIKPKAEPVKKAVEEKKTQ